MNSSKNKEAKIEMHLRKLFSSYIVSRAGVSKLHMNYSVESLNSMWEYEIDSASAIRSALVRLGGEFEKVVS